MATVQTDGSSAVTKDSTVNNKGTVVGLGASSSIFNNKTLGSSPQEVFGSTPIENATKDYADKALSAGDFKHENPRGVMQLS